MLWGVDPVQGGADLAEIKARIGGQVCLWGGMNSFVTLGTGSEEEIRAAVRQAMQTLSPGQRIRAEPGRPNRIGDPTPQY